jgi:tetratricopeptide (TPR) repeat protein
MKNLISWVEFSKACFGFFGWPGQLACPGARSAQEARGLPLSFFLSLLPVAFGDPDKQVVRATQMPRILLRGALLLLVVAAVIGSAGRAQAASLDDANRVFAAGQYQASTQGYETVLAQNGYSAPVLFDLGNSYYREGDFARAILAYQRARVLAPEDADIAANLALAQKQGGLAVTDAPWSEKVTRILSASGWAWLGCVAWTLLCGSLLLRTVLPRRRFVFSVGAMACAFVLLDAIAALALSSGQLREAVVVDKNAAALISPFPAAQTVFSPVAGETVAVQKAYGDFLLVTDHAGHTGWVSKAQVTPVVPLG